jgi:DNA-binding CsgD family transcriptional regulator
MDRFQALGMETWFEQAAVLAQSLTSIPIEYPDGLTGREMEVLHLVASGHSSKEIAARFVISVATVQRHIANVYAKIDARGRADATAYAVRHGMLRP